MIGYIIFLNNKEIRLMSDFKVLIGMLGIEAMFDGRASDLVEAARMADEADIDAVVLTDHVVMGEHTDNYPYGDFPLPPGTDWHEPMTVLSAIAGATENIRLATGILISPLRNAALLAKIAATLDCVSNGRLDLGVGTGWQKEEYDACGLSFKNRIGQLEDQLRAMQLLWCQAPASFSSDTVNFDRIYCNPFPIQEGGIPLWMGMAPGPRALSLLAECCVGWVPMPMSLEELKPKIDLVREAFVKAGRDPNTLRVRAQPQVVFDKDNRADLDRTLDNLQESLDAGITDVQFLTGMFVSSRDQLPEYFAKIAARRS